MALKKFLKSGKDKSDNEKLKKIIQESQTGAAAHDESNWLVSYADMMTLLCGFFIMMFSMAKLDEPKYEGFKEQVAKSFGGQYKSPTKELANFVTQVIQEAGVEKETVVRSDPLGVSVVFHSTLFFDTLGTDIKPEGKTVLDKLIAKIKEHQITEKKEYRIVIEGHTDGRPVVSGVFPSNWELSGARASRVVRMFLEMGFAPDHLMPIGYADTHPEVPERLPAGGLDETALAKNRRVIIRILDPKVELPWVSSAH